MTPSPDDGEVRELSQSGIQFIATVSSLYFPRATSLFPFPNVLLFDEIRSHTCPIDSCDFCLVNKDEYLVSAIHYSSYEGGQLLGNQILPVQVDLSKF